MRFNIALVPLHNSEQFVAYAKTLSSTVKVSNYHIRTDVSIPHVSLSHFACEPNEIQAIWQKILALKLPVLHLSFAFRRNKIYPGKFKKESNSSVSLIPDHLETLKKWHLQVANIIQKPLNAAFDNYDPHMTLFNSKQNDVCSLFNQKSQLKQPLEDDFILSLGKIDRAGQIIEIVS